MTSRQRVCAAFEGRRPDRMPVAMMYLPLYQQDHFAELTGREQWEVYRWLNDPPEEHLALFREMTPQTPFDMIQPHYAPSRQAREQVEYIEKDGRLFRHDKKEDNWQPIDLISGHATDYRANEIQRLYDETDIRDQVRITRAEDIVRAGLTDYMEAVVREYGDREFIVTGAVVGTLYSCHHYLGLTNLFEMLVEKPGLVESLSRRIMEQNIEALRAYAAAGGDALYIDDATATSDMISVAHYERFSLPYMREMVREIHRLGHKAILIYFGGIADRLEQIASIGADALLMEASMKGYTNDIGAIAGAIGHRITLFGNINPVTVIQNASDAELEAEIARQSAAGRRARGFILSPGSPITPSTPLSRVQAFIKLAHRHGAY